MCREVTRQVGRSEAIDRHICTDAAVPLWRSNSRGAARRSFRSRRQSLAEWTVGDESDGDRKLGKSAEYERSPSRCSNVGGMRNGHSELCGPPLMHDGAPWHSTRPRTGLMSSLPAQLL